jgi:hypothetical protein
VWFRVGSGVGSVHVASGNARRPPGDPSGLIGSSRCCGVLHRDSRPLCRMCIAGAISEVVVRRLCHVCKRHLGGVRVGGCRPNVGADGTTNGARKGHGPAVLGVHDGAHRNVWSFVLPASWRNTGIRTRSHRAATSLVQRITSRYPESNELTSDSDDRCSRSR